MQVNMSKFFLIWKVVFKYLFYTVIGVMIFKIFLFVLHDELEHLKLKNVLLAFGIYTAGVALLAAIISLWAVIKDGESQKKL